MPAIMAMAAGAAVSGLGSALGAKSQREGYRQARAYQMWQNAQLAPYRQAGQQALGQFQEGLGQMPTYQNALATLMQDPAYQFAQQEAARATQGSAAAQNMLLSGRAQQALQDRAMNIANTMGADIYNRQFNEWATRQNALQNLMSGGMNAIQGAPNGAQTALGMGQVGANRVEGIGNALQSGLQNFALYSMLKPQVPAAGYGLSNFASGMANAPIPTGGFR